ncbi:MAG TPA: 2-C-methyl-D-erythritol 2,4-cyclodiphosphate synthase [Candidatus Limnocylindrales bacterium]|nr:2-C-methyl-D-erythritol 2,4-cyclodiphosphate synthase [Candidatus Limnocylindrales bacterium]
MAESEAGAGGSRGRETRTGFATDVHPFGPGDGLWLGGIEIPAAPRLHGHSDGDVALHAIGGALLGAAGLGDLGGVYPADERTRRGIPSSELLGGIVAKLAAAGWRPWTVDVTISAGRPRIGPSMPAMRERIAQLLDVDVEAVNVQASTGNLSGDVGAGRVIAAGAVATVARTGVGESQR